eukprot:RCo014677
MEELQNRLKALERQLLQKDEELKAAREEREVLDGLVVANQQALRRTDSSGKDANTSSSSGSSPPRGDTTTTSSTTSTPGTGGEDRAVAPLPTSDAIDRLEASLRLERLRMENVSKEKKTAEQQLKAKEKELEKAVAELEEIRTETGWSRANTTSRAPFKESRNAAAAEERISELQRQLQRLHQEDRATKALERKREQHIENLAKDVEQKTRLEQELIQANNMLKVKDKEIRDLSEELKMMKRIESKKDKLIVSMEMSKDPGGSLKALEGDKRAL